MRGLAGADAGGVSHPSGISSWSVTLDMVSLFNCGHLIGVCGVSAFNLHFLKDY